MWACYMAFVCCAVPNRRIWGTGQIFMERYMKIYTGKGDNGTAGLLSNERVPKNHERINAFGDIDELGSVLGVLRASLATDMIEPDNQIRRIQSDLLKIGACLSAWRNEKALSRLQNIGDKDILFLETSIDSIEEVLPELKGFLLSGGHPSAALAHFARAVCRRAERKVVGLSIELKAGRPAQLIKPFIVYLNRLSDYLFVFSRYCNHRAHISDDLWKI